MLNDVRSATNVLEGGDWMGQGANAFYAEMNGAVLPSLIRLTRALADAQRVTIQISREIKAAEDAAAAVLHADGAEGETNGGSSKLARLEQGLVATSFSPDIPVNCADRPEGCRWISDPEGGAEYEEDEVRPK